MVRILRTRGRAAAAAVVLVALLLQALFSWTTVESIRFSQFAFDQKSSLGGGGGDELLLQQQQEETTQISTEVENRPEDWPSFREAPAFKNDKQCVSAERKKKKNNGAEEEICDASAVHIAMTLDVAYLRGSMAAVFSILKHSSCPENVIFHFLVGNRDAGLRSLIFSTFPFLRFKVYHFDEALVKSRISASVRLALEHPLNYARSYLADILEPCVERVIYLDSDLIVVDDIVKLWGIRLGSRAIGAPEYCHTNFTKYFTDSFWSNKAFTKVFDHLRNKPCYFNTGVMVMNLVKWREQNYRSTIESWMKRQKEARIYELGSLPPFLLVFAGNVEPIDHRWNQHGLGGDNLEGRCRPLHPGPVSLLHWSGKGKPWIRLDARKPCSVDNLWAPYDLRLPSMSSYLWLINDSSARSELEILQQVKFFSSWSKKFFSAWTLKFFSTWARNSSAVGARNSSVLGAWNSLALGAWNSSVLGARNSSARNLRFFSTWSLKFFSEELEFEQIRTRTQQMYITLWGFLASPDFN